MPSIQNKISSFVSGLDPKSRRILTIVLAIIAILIISYAFFGLSNVVGSDNKAKRRAIKGVEFLPLTGSDTSKLSGDVMAERIRLLEGELDKIKNGDLTLDQPGQAPAQPAQKSEPGDVSLSKVLNPEGADQNSLPGNIFAPGIVPPPVRKKLAQTDTSINAAIPTDNNAPLFSGPLFPMPNDKNKKPDVSSSTSPPKGTPNTVSVTVETPPGDPTNINTDNAVFEGNESKRKLIIREIKEDIDKSEAKDSLDKPFSSINASVQEQGLFMPSGSIISGILITGMDAPTANQTRKDPFPVLLRIKEESLLPNYMKMDIRECFLIASGYGDMSSERAYIRAETVSCVRPDGKVIESAVNAFAVGEDGKNGVRGRLVSKTGAMVGKSLMAGFLAGMADAMKPQQVPTNVLSTVAGTAQKQSVFEVDPEQLLSRGAFGGANTALSKIADYYIEMARSIFPIVEIDAGRKIDFIVMRGTRLAIQAGSNPHQSNQRSSRSMGVRQNSSSKF